MFMKKQWTWTTLASPKMSDNNSRSYETMTELVIDVVVVYTVFAVIRILFGYMLRM